MSKLVEGIAQAAINKQSAALTMLLQPTMSRSDLYLACQWPFGRADLPNVAPNEYMIYGRGFHRETEALIHHMLGTMAAPESSKELPKKHAHDVFHVLEEWLKGENEWHIDFTDVRMPLHAEIPVAYNMLKDTARQCKPVDAAHIYPDRKKHEICGTADIAVKFSLVRQNVIIPTVLILDHKTGITVDPPASMEQLRSLALGFARLWNCDRAIVAVFHAPRDQPELACVYADEMSADDLKAHAKALRAAHKLEGTGYMRPGPHCAGCPGNAVCPMYGASLGAIVQASKSPSFDVRKIHLELSSPEKVGEAHVLIQTYDGIRDTIAGAIRDWVAANGPGFRRDGKIVTLVPSTRESLSKSSIVRALGPVKGAELIEELRQKGCVETSTRTELRAINDNG